MIEEYSLDESKSRSITPSSDRVTEEEDDGLRLVSMRQNDGTVRFEHALKRKRARRGTNLGLQDTPPRDEELNDLEDKTY